ncbi:phosphate-starvation-inducible PsiE family protein [Desulfonatronovibrio magnus]|uniref:phosphate-starvation-inducible PsiE family protein n=1 Tax=Desulfonatronovibrio magnus TaxID=698827 RepID=UPI000698E1D3|nr:phosphate-starvation-inducible PsiE family protein [Desulfonatronovibrio magnus]
MDEERPLKPSKKDDELKFCIGSGNYDPEYPVLKFLKLIIRYAVVVLAITMTLVIIWGVGDVIWVLVNRLQEPPYMLLSISDILATFGAFIAVLIAIEIFVNITLYLDGKIIHVKLVLATALMAIARKVIIFDYEKLGPEYVWATAAVIFALVVGYWLVDE